MKHTLLHLLAKHFSSFCIICMMSMLVWFVFPLIVIGNQYPFLTYEKRGYFIALIFIAWILKLFFLSKKTSPLDASEEETKRIHVLQKRFEGAVRFLKKTHINKQSKKINLAELPWALLIGPKGSGKTSLLTQANINFILTKKFNQEKSLHSETCDWWATRDLVLVDVPGFYLHEKANFIWTRLLGLLKKNKKNLLNTVVITLPLPEILKDPQQKKSFLSQIKTKIQQLQKQFPHPLNFYFVITKCDLIPGFTEFFSECSIDELNQTWGISLPTLKSHENLLAIFNQRFNGLIQRLNKQLIWRLHQERNASARLQIKDFPLQLERVKQLLLSCLRHFSNESLHLQGIYLTSAIQTPIEETSAQILNPHIQQPLQLLRNPPAPVKAYFIRQLLLQGLLSNADLPDPKAASKNAWHQKLAYALSITAVLTTAFLLGKDFQRSVIQTYAIQNYLSQYELSIQQSSDRGEHLIRALPLLTYLHGIASTDHKIAHFFEFYSKKSQHNANVVYQKILQTVILPEIKKYFEAYLQNNSEKNPAQLYAVLKSYLMLNDSKQFKAAFIAKTLNQLMPNQFNAAMVSQFSSHLSTALHQNAAKITLDNQLITQTRKYLTNLSKEELAFVILKNISENSAYNNLNLGANSSAFVSPNVLQQLPAMFTAAAYPNIMNHDIALAANEALQGNFVIGQSAIFSNEATINALAENVRSRYIANYIDTWESLLANLKLASPKDLAQMDAMIVSLTGDSSPLLDVLQTIQKNTAFEAIQNASPKLQELTGLLANATNNSQENPLYQLFASLRQLHSYLQSILTSATPDKTAFETAKQRMLHSKNDPISELYLLAEQSSEPLKSWLTTLAADSWGFILSDAAHFIEDLWHINIYSIFQGQIAKNFPFNPAAEQDVDLQQFSEFLGREGSLANFYSFYLKPFIDESQKNWQWQVINNKKLPFSNTVLEQLQNITNLQQTLFPDGDNKLLIQFSLQPISLDKDMRSFHLNINGQQVAYEKSFPKHSQQMTWPGENSLHNTVINFVASDNQLIGNTLKGDWGWLRLLNQSNQTIVSKKQTLLNFNVNGHNVKYMMLTQSDMNPFLSENFKQINLPDQLSEMDG